MAALIVLGVAAVSCSSPDFVDRATLLREPAAEVRFPGTVELAHVGSDRVTTIEGTQSAFDGYVLGTSAAAEEVRAYYARKLQDLGWQPDRLAGIPSTAEIDAWGWCNPA